MVVSLRFSRLVSHSSMDKQNSATRVATKKTNTQWFVNQLLPPSIKFSFLATLLMRQLNSLRCRIMKLSSLELSKFMSWTHHGLIDSTPLSTTKDSNVDHPAKWKNILFYHPTLRQGDCPAWQIPLKKQCLGKEPLAMISILRLSVFYCLCFSPSGNILLNKHS